LKRLVSRMPYWGISLRLLFVDETGCSNCINLHITSVLNELMFANNLVRDSDTRHCGSITKLRKFTQDWGPIVRHCFRNLPDVAFMYSFARRFRMLLGRCDQGLVLFFFEYGNFKFAKRSLINLMGSALLSIH
jgi:hypothetical protein